MKQTMKINYRSVFKYESHQDSMKYEVMGEYSDDGNQETIRFFVDENKIEISITNQIILQNGNSKLHLVKNQKIENEYQSEYGILLITSELLSYKKTDHTYKIKYRLYDKDQFLAEVYVLIQLIEMRN